MSLSVMNRNCDSRKKLAFETAEKWQRSTHLKCMSVREHVQLWRLLEHTYTRTQKHTDGRGI